MPHIESLDVPRPIATLVLVTDPDHPDPAVLDAAVQTWLRGGLVAFATETVYGLGGIATNVESVTRTFAAKGRPAINPLIVHVASIAQARDCVAEWPVAAESLARRFWPGPLTLVLNRAGIIPDLVTAGKDTVAVRVPAGKVALGLIERLGLPISAPSANRSNRLSPTRAEHVLTDLDGRIDLIIDSGPTAIGLESTVLDLTTTPPRLLRPGPINRRELEEALDRERVEEHTSGGSIERPSSPGQMAVHYAPRTPAFGVDSLAELEHVPRWENVALVVVGEQDVSSLHRAASRFNLDSPELAARFLYDVLHRCDSLGRESIVVIMPPDSPEWQAVRDRLLRATRPLRSRRVPIVPSVR
jgi:L-threonylcarbamoyladenylate synthase